MGLFSGLASAFGGLTSADDTGVKTDANALQNAITSGAVQNAAAFGPTGTALNAHLAALGSQNVAFDPTAMDADSAALAPVQAHYLAQFQNGGLAGKAAVEAAQANRALNAQGGFAGIHADTLASGAAQQQVANVAQGEINNAASQVNSLDAQKAAMALQKAVFSAKVSHANLLNHLSAQNTQFGLRNAQQQLFNQAQSALNDTSNAATSTDQAFQQDQNKIGQAILQGLISAGSTGLTTAIGAAGAGTSDDDAQASALTASQSGVGAGYTLPAPAVSKAVVPSPGLQSTAFTTAPILPNTANAWNGGY